MVARFTLEQVSKRIGARSLLDRVSLELWPGEVHVLVGLNGAGKSTLIRILVGADSDFGGHLRLDGAPFRPTTPREARRAGIHVIHQELSLVGSLSIVDNWLLAEERAAFTWLSRDAARAKARAACERLALALDLETPVDQLSLSERQLVEIARAVSEQARVLILDEPSSALSEPEAERLLGEVIRAREAGAAVLYVSHRMEEIYRLADRVSVLCDGKLVLTRRAVELPRDELLAAMLTGNSAGEVSDDAPHPKNQFDNFTVTAPGRLILDQLGAPGRPGLVAVSASIEPGEIVGVAGLSGSGGDELMQILGGARAPSIGRIELAGRSLRFTSSEQAYRAGFAALGADRKLSVFEDLSVAWNATLSALARYSHFGVLARRSERADVTRFSAALGVRAPSLSAPARALSGGNQQKLALLRCLLTRPRVLLLEEPTRGVDVHAKREIYRIVREVAGQGVHTIVRSSELDELLALCSRVLVLHRGRLVADLPRADLERERLLSYMMGRAA